MESAQTPDAAAIASQVLASLDGDDRALADAGDALVLLSTSTPAAGPKELEERMRGLALELLRCCIAQRKLEREIGTLRQQLQQVPASIIRLEQWSAAAEARLAALAGHPAGNGLDAGWPAADVIDGCEDLQQWRSVREVAAALSLRQSTVRRYIRQGKLPAVRLPGGRGVRLAWPSVLAHLAQLASNTDPGRETGSELPDVPRETD